MKTKTTIIALLFAVAIIIIIPLFFALPGETRIWGEAQNFGHTLLFGIVAILILWTSRLLFEKRVKRQITHYLVAFGAAVFLGGLVEILQIFFPGDPDIGDFIRDILGAGAFLGFYMYFELSSKQALPGHSAIKRKMVLIISAILLSLSFLPGLLWAGAYLHRNKVFPLICSFDSIWERKFIETQDARLKSVSPPAQWNKPPGDRVGRLELFAVDHPGFYILEPGRDWNEYKYLSFEVFSELKAPLEVQVGVEDYIGKDVDEDRFSRTILIKPGLNEINIDLEDVRNGPLFRKLNLAAIHDIYMIVFKPGDGIILYIDDIRLGR